MSRYPIQELRSMDQRLEGPGVYVLPDSRQFGLKPMRSGDGKEWVPYFWATEFPPLGEFMMRFDRYWISHRASEAWVGGDFNAEGIYWCKYNPQALIKGGK